MENKTIVQLEKIFKMFPGGVIANKDANLKVQKGEIHAIVGENGAGKSTLMNILYGVHQPDRGKVYINQQEVTIDNPREAKKLGIGMVHQHFMLVPSFTVLENIILGYEPKKHSIFVDKKQAENEIKEICDRYSFNIPLHSLVKDISVGIQQRVEIIKAIYRGAEILILDEPTAVLTPLEVKELFDISREMVRKDKTILFISHKLKEVLEISDHITVMRSGSTLETLETKETNETELAQLIVGREHIWRIRNKKETKEKEKVLEVRNLFVKNSQQALAVKDVSFNVNSGEIVGIAGVEGNGQSELMESLTGLRPIEQGDVIFNNESLLGKSTTEQRALGIRHIPEDRMHTGASLKASITENFIIDTNDRNEFISKTGFMDWNGAKIHSQELINKYGVLAANPDILAGTLSGGNLQKVVVARELSGEYKCLFVLHPTRGLDIGASEFIYNQLISARDNMKAVLLVSADLDELFLLSDRILVIYEGSIAGEFKPDEISPEEVGLYMTGARNNTKSREVA